MRLVHETPLRDIKKKNPHDVRISGDCTAETHVTLSCCVVNKYSSTTYDHDTRLISIRNPLRTLCCPISIKKV
jgi:hypothetical protein